MTLFEQLKAFAKAKPRDEEYDHEDNQNCAVAQFAKSIDPLFTCSGYNYYMRLIDGANEDQVIITTGPTKTNLNYFDALMRSKTWGVLSDKLEAL